MKVDYVAEVLINLISQDYHFCGDVPVPFEWLLVEAEYLALQCRRK